VAPHHTNPLIPDSPERRRAAIRFFAAFTSPIERRAILAQYGVTHVVAPPRTPGNVFEFLETLGEHKPLPGGHVLFTLRR
jgi:hypothetical protein